MATVRERLDIRKVEGIVDRSPVLETMKQHRATELRNRARMLFLARQIPTNEWRTSETSPPKYVLSFRLQRVKALKHYDWRVVNNDPAAIWVEFGAHAGGRTLVLRYFPMTEALRSMRVTN
jgi:hypothetical protein